MTGNDTQQRRFWNELVTLRKHVYYLNEYYDKSDKIDRYISCLLALSSSGSIAGWAIWNEFGLIWAFIIATSQVVNAIKHYFPYKTRMKHITKLMNALDRLYIYAEHKWHAVSQGMLSNDEINVLTTKFKKRKCKYIHEMLDECSLPTNNKIMAIAESMAHDYFSHF